MRSKLMILWVSVTVGFGEEGRINGGGGSEGGGIASVITNFGPLPLDCTFVIKDSNFS
jgi:hypothetical protein